MPGISGNAGWEGAALHLALLIHTQHHRGFGRVQLEADNVIDLLHDSTNSGSLDSWTAAEGFPMPD